MKNLQKYLKKKKIGFYDEPWEESPRFDVPEDILMEDLQDTINNNDQLIAGLKQKLQSFMQGKIQGLISEISELDPKVAEQLTMRFKQFSSDASLDQYEENSRFIEECNQHLKPLLIQKIMEQQSIITAQENEMSQYEQKKEHE